MSVFVNPFTDFGFKRIFGQEDTKHILIGFLNALFEGEFVVQDLVYRDKEQLSEQKGERGVIFDIFCTTTEGYHFILEMQNKNQAHFEDRALYYVARSIVGQGRKGADWVYEYDAVIGIFFMNFVHEVLLGEFRSDFGIRNLKSGKPQELQVLTDKLRMVFLQMPQFTKTLEECETKLDKWTYIIKNMETLNEMPWREQEELFDEISKVASVAALSEEERNRYEDALRNYRDNIDVRNADIHEERIRMARLMMADNCISEIISKYTSLSLDEIEKLRR